MSGVDPVERLHRLQTDPIGIVTRRARMYVESARYWYEEKLPRVRYAWPVYDIYRYFRNRESVRLYQAERAAMTPDAVQRRVIHELQNEGISIIHYNDLLAPTDFSDLQALAEARLRTPENQERIRAIEAGAKPHSKWGKYYLVKMRGEPPEFEYDDPFVGLSLSSRILTIIGGYLGALGRLGAVDLWYNLPTGRPAMLSQRWHRDPEDRRQVKMFLYLRDVTDDGGPFCFVRRTHNGGPFANFRRQAIHGSNYPEDHVIENKFPELQMRCTGKAGTLIFCDTTGFHKGGDPKTQARLLFNAVYTTNAGIPVITGDVFYRLSNLGKPDSRAAQYAIGHLPKR